MQFGNLETKSYIKIQMKKNSIKDLKKCALSKKIETQYKISLERTFKNKVQRPILTLQKFIIKI